MRTLSLVLCVLWIQLVRAEEAPTNAGVFWARIWSDCHQDQDVELAMRKCSTLLTLAESALARGRLGNIFYEKCDFDAAFEQFDSGDARMMSATARLRYADMVKRSPWYISRKLIPQTLCASVLSSIVLSK